MSNLNNLVRDLVSISDEEIELSGSDGDSSYEITEADKRDELLDLVEDGVSISKRRAESNDLPPSKRIRTKTNRFGSTSSSDNHNAFFENILSTTTTTQSSSSKKSSGTLVNTCASPCEQSQNQNSSDQILQLLVKKISRIEDFLIKLDIKLDNSRQSGRTFNKNAPTEIDISELGKLGLPAESQKDIDKLEENLKNEDFKQKLTVIMESLDDGRASGDYVLERLMHCLINPKYLPKVSWTGRGKGKERKVALSSCVQLINFIVVTVNKIDKNYNHKKVVSEITYGILKRAPSKFGNRKEKENIVPPSNDRTCDDATATISVNSCSPVSANTDTNSVPSLSIASSSSSSSPNDYYQKLEAITTMNQRALHPPPFNYWDGRYPAYGYPPHHGYAPIK